MYQLIKHDQNQAPCNKGKLVGQKLPLKLQEIWAIRTRLQMDKQYRDLALFNLAPLIGPRSQPPEFCRMCWSRSGAGHAPLRSRYW